MDATKESVFYFPLSMTAMSIVFREHFTLIKETSSLSNFIYGKIDRKGKKRTMRLTYVHMYNTNEYTRKIFDRMKICHDRVRLCDDVCVFYKMASSSVSTE